MRVVEALAAMAARRAIDDGSIPDDDEVLKGFLLGFAAGVDDVIRRIERAEGGLPLDPPERQH